MININDLNTVELLGYAYSALNRIENAYIGSKDEITFKKIFNPKNLDKFIKNLQQILIKLDCPFLNEKIAISLHRFNRNDVSIYEGLDYIIFNKYCDESQFYVNEKNNFNYDVSFLN